MIAALAAITVSAAADPPHRAPAYGERAREHHHYRYYADDHYRDGRHYRDRRLTRRDWVYRGRDGRYYCRRSDGTTGLIVGSAIGALIGRELGRGDSRVLGALILGGTGALLGREIDRGRIRCD